MQKTFRLFFDKEQSLTLRIEDSVLISTTSVLIEGTKDDKKYYVFRDHIKYFRELDKDDEIISHQG